jgi:hypothetical protein
MIEALVFVVFASALTGLSFVAQGAADKERRAAP